MHNNDNDEVDLFDVTSAAPPAPPAAPPAPAKPAPESTPLPNFGRDERSFETETNVFSIEFDRATGPKIVAPPPPVAPKPPVDLDDLDDLDDIPKQGFFSRLFGKKDFDDDLDDIDTGGADDIPDVDDDFPKKKFWGKKSDFDDDDFDLELNVSIPKKAEAASPSASAPQSAPSAAVYEEDVFDMSAAAPPPAVSMPPAPPVTPRPAVSTQPAAPLQPAAPVPPITPPPAASTQPAEPQPQSSVVISIPSMFAPASAPPTAPAAAPPFAASASVSTQPSAPTPTPPVAAPAPPLPPPPVFGRIAHVCLFVRSLDTSVKFYSAIGMKKRFAFNKKGKVYGAYMEFGEGGNFIELFEDPARANAPNGRLAHFCLETTDINAVTASLTARGISFTPKKFGCDATYQIWLKDPDGNDFEVHQYTPKSSQVIGGDVEADW